MIAASVFLAALVAAKPAASTGACDTFSTRVHITMNDTSEKSTKTLVEVCELDNQIHMAIEETDTFAHVEALEDYNSGFSAEAAHSVCLISKLKFSNIKDRVHELRSQSDRHVSGEGNLNMYPVTDSDVASFSEDIINFCEGLEMYKVAEDSYTELANYDDPNALERCIFLLFGPQCVIWFCTLVCFTTQLSVPTGTTVVFYWFFG